MIIDAHHHLWHYVPGEMAWLDRGGDSLKALHRDFLPSEFRGLLESHGIDGSVIIQSNENVAETMSMLTLAKANDFIKGVVGWVELEDTRAAEKQLAKYAQKPKLKGFRHLQILFEPDPDWFVTSQVLESLKLVAEYGFAYDFTHSVVQHLAHVSTVAERLPHLRVVIDSLGKPAASEGLWEPWASLMARAATYPNVYVKLAALTNMLVSTKPITVSSKEQFQPYVDHVLQHFGATRTIVASNWPSLLLGGGDYDRTWSDTVALIAHLSETDRAAIMGGNAVRFYRL